jgi:hypothetical protein
MHPPLALFIQIRENSLVCFLLKQVKLCYSQSRSISTVVIVLSCRQKTIVITTVQV